jgi:hypothetical protein
VPFIGWPRQWVQPAYGFVWVCESPAAIVSQCIHEHASIIGVNALHDALDEIVALGFLAVHPGAIIIHDWRSVRTLEAGARDAWSKRSARPGKPMQAAGTSYLAVVTGSIMRMTIQTAALTVQLATGQPPIRVIDDPATPLAAHGIHAPARDLFARLRGRTIPPPT